jgi:indole-3-glycerol phosphate synthase
MSGTGGVNNRDLNTALVANGNTASIVVGFRYLYAIVADSDIHVVWGTAASIVNAAATDFLIPAKTIVVQDMGEEFDRLRVFAATGATGNVYIMRLSRA